MINTTAYLFTLLVVLFAGSSNAQNVSEQCVTDTTAINPAFNETLSALPNPTQECAKILESGLLGGSGIQNCSIDASEYADTVKAACEELGGRHFVGDFELECVISGAFVPNSTTMENAAFSWVIQNDNYCLGVGCTDEDYQIIMNEVFGGISTQLGQLGSCQYSVGPSVSNPDTSPTATTTPGSPTLEPSPSNPDATPTTTTATPGISPTLEPSTGNLVDGQPPASSTNPPPASTPAPTSSTKNTFGMIALLLLPVGVVSWITSIC
jgi:hypothetical protein